MGTLDTKGGKLLLRGAPVGMVEYCGWQKLGNTVLSGGPAADEAQIPLRLTQHFCLLHRHPGLVQQSASVVVGPRCVLHLSTKTISLCYRQSEMTSEARLLIPEAQFPDSVFLSGHLSLMTTLCKIIFKYLGLKQITSRPSVMFTLSCAFKTDIKYLLSSTLNF